MKTRFLPQHLLGLALAAAPLFLSAPRVPAQNVTDEIEVIRGVLKTDRKVVVAETMQLSETESAAFWPLYREYRTDMDRIGDGLVKLILEYADAYPAVPEERAAALLKNYQALEKNWLNTRARHLKRIGKVLPASKVLRFAQVENRLDLALRLQLAGALPLVPGSARR